MARQASADWNGGLNDGEGKIALGTGAFEGPYTWKSRLEEEPGTNPEELIAAAHAGCFTMNLATQLELAGNKAEHLHTDAKVHMRIIDDAPQIVRITLRTTGRVPGIDQETFQKTAEKSKEICVISRALAAIEDMNVEATLED